MRLVVTLDEYHWHAGRQGDPEGCALWRALKVALPLGWRARVFTYSVDVANHLGNWATIPLPAPVALYVERFDLGVAPPMWGSFSLVIPEGL